MKNHELAMEAMRLYRKHAIIDVLPPYMPALFWNIATVELGEYAGGDRKQLIGLLCAGKYPKDIEMALLDMMAACPNIDQKSAALHAKRIAVLNENRRARK
jgi:hypothetical protein